MERHIIDILSELSDESKKKLYDALKDFDFDGRCEFWDEQDCCDEALYEIHKALLKKDYQKAKKIFINVCTEFYRYGFSRGCRAGFDDLSILLNLKNGVEFSYDSWRRMNDAIPRYNEKNQELKEWRRNYKKNPDQAPFAASANIRQK